MAGRVRERYYHPALIPRACIPASRCDALNLFLLTRPSKEERDVSYDVCART